jgi:hypothetical protein
MPNDSSDVPELSNFIPLADASKLLPGRPHTKTIYRWCKDGYPKGDGRIPLSWCKVGRRIMISKDELIALIREPDNSKRSDSHKTRVSPRPTPRRHTRHDVEDRADEAGL